MIILGIDPGIAIVGYGIIEYKNNKFKVIDYGAITTPSSMNDIKRLEKIYKGIYILIKNYNIDEVAVEELFFNKNVKTAITVAQAGGVSCLDVLIIINQLMNTHLFKLSKVLLVMEEQKKFRFNKWLHPY